MTSEGLEVHSGCADQVVLLIPYGSLPSMGHVRLELASRVLLPNWGLIPTTGEDVSFFQVPGQQIQVIR